MMPDNKGYGGLKEYNCKAQYELIISRENIKKYRDSIGFLHDTKQNKLNNLIQSYASGMYKEHFLATFDNLEYIGQEEVFDLTEMFSHTFVANGIQITNCGEQMLEDFGSCNLGSINLGKFVENGEWILDELEQTINIAVRLLNRVIDVNVFPLQELSDMNQLTRRIGLGVMGWHDALVKLGISYDSDEALKEAEYISAFLTDKAWKESEGLAEIDGPFPNYYDSRIANVHPPVRNSDVTTVAPTGTISRIAECSFGIEPFFDLAWESNVLHDEGKYVTLLDCPTSIREAVNKTFDNEEDRNSFIINLAREKDVNSLLKIGLNPELFKCAHDISVGQHVKMQAAWQKNITNSVSKTVNMPNNGTLEDVKELYWSAWELGLKGITMYRSGTREVEVLSKTHLPTEDASIVKSDSIIFKRPAKMTGNTQRVSTGHGNMYVTMNYDEDDQLKEVFSNMSKSGACHNASLEAISRLVSVALQHNVPLSEIIKQLDEITCCPTWHEGISVKSPYDALAMVLNQNKPRIKKSTKRCDCGGEMVDAGGCPVCLSCGLSKC